MNQHWLSYIKITLVLTLYLDVSSFATPTDTTISRFGSLLFESDSILKITLKIDAKTLFKDIGDDRVYHPAKMIYTKNDNTTDSLNIEICTRGDFRRNPQNCNLPPFSLKIPKEEKKNHPLFADQKKIKLVHPCRRSEDYQQFVIQEYLVYKMFNLLTEYSFRVRLLEITYKDTLNNYDTFTKIGFFIEDNDLMASRNNAKVTNLKNINPEETDYRQVTLIYLFQFMVGNTDWSVHAPHNIELIKIEDENRIVPVPFDFDWCGMVSATYAVPQKFLGIKTVRDRLYMGYCRTNAQLYPFVTFFNEKKPKIAALYLENPYLTNNQKKNSINYLNGFYKIMNSDAGIKYNILNTCKN